MRQILVNISISFEKLGFINEILRSKILIVYLLLH